MMRIETKLRNRPSKRKQQRNLIFLVDLATIVMVAESTKSTVYEPQKINEALKFFIVRPINDSEHVLISFNLSYSIKMANDHDPVLHSPQVPQY